MKLSKVDLDILWLSLAHYIRCPTSHCVDKIDLGKGVQEMREMRILLSRLLFEEEDGDDT